MSDLIGLLRFILTAITGIGSSCMLTIAVVYYATGHKKEKSDTYLKIGLALSLLYLMYKMD